MCCNITATPLWLTEVADSVEQGGESDRKDDDGMESAQADEGSFKGSGLFEQGKLATKR